MGVAIGELVTAFGLAIAAVVVCALLAKFLDWIART